MNIKIWIACPSQTARTTDLSVSGEPVLIGRSVGHLRVDDEHCSRVHAALVRRTDGTVWLRDLGSRNGTYLNGKKISETQIAAGTEIRIGLTKFVVLALQTPEPPISPPLSNVVTGWPEYYNCISESK